MKPACPTLLPPASLPNPASLTRLARSLGLAALAGLAAPAAQAQQVIICYTLRTELNNFDRRTRPHDEAWRALQLLQRDADRVSTEFRNNCVQGLRGEAECSALNERATSVETELYQRMTHYAQSPTGQGDPARRALVAEQMRQGCLWQQQGSTVKRLDPATLEPKGPPLKVKG